MEVNLFQVDAFAEHVFEGNPAAVCPLECWLEDDVLQKVAQENNLSETAFFVQEDERVQLRWFTPLAEVDLCGHATLAAAHVLFKHLAYQHSVIAFSTRSGELSVKKVPTGYSIDFPATIPTPTVSPTALLSGLESRPEATLKGFDYIIVLKNEQAVVSAKPDLTAWATLDLRGVLITAPGDDVDFVSRCFFPKLGVDEDPVTGSAHCELAPYWGDVLGKTNLTGKQLSARTGAVKCELNGERVVLTGNAVDYMQGVIYL